MSGHGLDEVATGVLRICAPLGERFVACYLLIGEDAAALVDCGDFGHPEMWLERSLAAAGVPPEKLRFIVVTHSDADHAGGLAAATRLAPSARVIAHRLEAVDLEDVEALIRHRYRYAADFGVDGLPERVLEIRRRYVPTPIDLLVDARVELPLGPGHGVEVRHAPGHSAGHLMLLDRRSNSAVIGDAVLAGGVPAADGTPALPPPYRDVDAYLRTVELVEGWSPERILTAHFPVLEEDADCQAFLAASRDFVVRLERELGLVLADGVVRDLPWLCERLAPALGSWPRPAWRHLAAPILGHVERWEANGIAERRTAPSHLPGWRLRSA